MVHMHMVHMHMPTRPGHGKSARTIQRHTDASRPRNTAFTATARRRRHQHFRHRHRSGLRSGHRTSHSQSERHRTDCHGCLVDQPHAECPRPESARRCAGIALPRVSTDRGPLAGLNIRKPLRPRGEYLLSASSPRRNRTRRSAQQRYLPALNSSIARDITLNVALEYRIPVWANSRTKYYSEHCVVS